MGSFLFTSESVTEGHPDKLADRIADAILDAHLRIDPHSRVATEVLIDSQRVVLAGEVSDPKAVAAADIARAVILEVGYNHQELGFDGHQCQVEAFFVPQSVEIASGVTSQGPHALGAGDSGLVFGYACDETPTLMPAPCYMAHQLARRLAEVRKKGILPFLRPDGKVQCIVAYEHGVFAGIAGVILSTQHNPDVSLAMLRDAIMAEVIEVVIPAQLRTNLNVWINPAGSFVRGGPGSDTGLTGRKIIVDTYGGMARHGGGAFSGKDPTKVDRSGAYYGRYIAKNIVASGLARRCEVQLAFGIGLPKPLMLQIECFGTERIQKERLLQVVAMNFQEGIAQMIGHLDLARPIYEPFATYGHFGRVEEDPPWERLARASALADMAGPLCSASFLGSKPWEGMWSAGPKSC